MASIAMKPGPRAWGVSDVVARPLLSAPIIAVAGIQIAAVAAGVAGWSCPLHALTGIPCPGCGLSRACVALLRGEWGEAMSLHALAPAFLLLTIALTASVVLPARQRERAAALVLRLESRPAIPLVALSVLVVYWLVRLALGWRG